MQRLTKSERDKLARLYQKKIPLRAIGRTMKRDHTVIGRELERNKGAYLPYDPDRAQRYAERRIHKKKKTKFEKYPELKEYVTTKIKEGLSPEQIAGVLKGDDPPPELHGVTICTESIYTFVYAAPLMDGLQKKLRRKRLQRRNRHGRVKQARTLLKERISIHARPPEINERKEFGHWESDSMVFSKQHEGLSVQYERSMQLVRMNKIANRSAQETEDALRNSIESLPGGSFKTLTFDNGGEGAHHMTIRDEFDIDTYFCDPYASWQKGGVENKNGLISEYLPRSINLSTLNGREIYLIQERLNNRPRKGLGYKTPNQKLKEYLEMVH